MTARSDNCYLSIAPFRAWLTHELDRYRYDENPVGRFARRLGVAERRLWGWLHENHRAPLDVIDRALCTYGRPDLLNELYPVQVRCIGFGDLEDCCDGMAEVDPVFCPECATARDAFVCALLDERAA